MSIHVITQRADMTEDEIVADELRGVVDRLREIAANPIRYKVTRKLLTATDRIQEAVDELLDTPERFRGKGE